MKIIVTDTAFLIDLQRGDDGAHAALRDMEANDTSLVIPSVAVTEYIGGSVDVEGDLERLQATGQLMPFTVDDAVAAGQVARDAFQTGTFPGWNDCLIRGFAKNRGFPVVTRNGRNFPDAVTY